MRRPETLLQCGQIHRLPQLKQQRIVGIIIAVMEVDQIVRPDIALADWSYSLAIWSKSCP